MKDILVFSAGVITGSSILALSYWVTGMRTRWTYVVQEHPLPSEQEKKT